MKKTALMLLSIAALITLYQCKSPTTTTNNNGTFSFTIQADNSFSNLPALQSFVLGENGDHWLLFGGRTNGFHGFSDPNQNFPYSMANQYIYVYNTATHACDSVPAAMLWADLRDQFTATNICYRQVDSFLYLCGGYGVTPHLPDSPWTTQPIMSRVNIPRMVSAVLNHDSIALRRSVVYFQNGLVASTGGELFKIGDDFYLCVGHNFTNKYSSPNAVQQYLDEVRVFRLQETDSSITMVMPIQTITDGLPDSTTQFRRRDLVVAPNVQQGGSNYGISIYGGVFTYTSGCPSCNGGNPFRYPIYISPGGNPAYRVDSSYTQASNIYSAPNLQMYDSQHDLMYTTIFGGLGDTLYPGGPGGDNASFTKLVLTIARNNQNGNTNAIYNTSNMPAWAGIEGAFVHAPGITAYSSNKMGIIDYQSIPTGTNTIGYIYGGILSDTVGWSHSNPTIASGTVYKVSITKN